MVTHPRTRWTFVVLLACSALAGGARSAFAQEDSPSEEQEARRSEARKHFELGVAHFDRQEWQAALVEFLRSRELTPTRANTKNAAICLRKVGRFDEALDLFEALLRDFPDLPPADRDLAQREIAELSASVGSIELVDAPAGAHVSIDGIERGTAPLAGPVRLPAGTHTVRVVKEGMPPFETRVDLAGRRTAVVRVKIASLTQAGRLRVVEKTGKKVDVVVDGARVGKAPWDGVLAPGVHSVWLAGPNDLGTPPARVSIEVGKEVTLELVSQLLESALEVRAEPSTAEIALDGVPAGRGSWEGRLRRGVHRVDVTLAGHEPFSRLLTLGKGGRERVVAVLEPRLPDDQVVLELDAGVLIGLLWGGDLDDACTSPCTSTLPLGVHATAHASYRFAAGVGVGVHAGYLRTSTTFSGRNESHRVSSSRSNDGVVDDQVRLSGLLAGAEADYAFGATWPFTLRIAAGALIGAATDSRTGTFEDSAQMEYEVSATQAPRATYFYVAPEVRIGYRIGEHFQASVGAKLFVLTALDRPTWDSSELYRAGETDKAGTFGRATLTGGTMLTASPGAALRYVF